MGLLASRTPLGEKPKAGLLKDIDFSKLVLGSPGFSNPSGVSQSTPQTSSHGTADVLSDIGTALDRTSGAIPYYLSGKTAPQGFSEQVHAAVRGDDLLKGKPVGVIPEKAAAPIAVIGAMIGDPLNLIGGGASKVAKIPKELEALAAEARKYTTKEDFYRNFVDAKGASNISWKPYNLSWTKHGTLESPAFQQFAGNNFHTFFDKVKPSVPDDIVTAQPSRNIPQPPTSPTTLEATPPQTPPPAMPTPRIEPSPSSKIGNTFNTLKTNILEYVQNTEERIRQLQKRPDLKIDDSTNIYQRMTLMPGRIQARVTEGYTKAEEIADDIVSIAGRSKTAIESTRNEVNDYLQALHAPERNKAIGEGASGMTTDEALKVTATARAEIRAVADKALDLNKQTLDILKDAGVISENLFDALRTKYQNHVPLQRVMDEADDIGEILSGRGLDVKSTGIRRAVGSGREVADILTNILTNYEQAVIRAEKNIVDNTTLAFVRQNEKEISDLFEIKKPRAVGESFDKKPLLERTNDPSILQLYENGKPIWIKVKDPNLAIAIRGVGREKLGLFMRGVNAITRFYSGLATRFNPEFALPNKIRDLQETMTFLASQGDVGFKGAASAAAKDPSSVKAITDWLRGADTAGAKLYEEMRSLGGTTGGMGLSTRNQVEINIDKLFNSARSRPRYVAQKLIQYVDNFNTIFEDSTRLSVYKSAISRGLSKERAAFLAKEASINFNRMGKGGPIINALYMFSNASIQGSTKMIRAMANPKVAASVVTLVGSSVAAVNTWNDRIDPEWRDKVTKWDRMNGLVVMLPSEEGSRYFVVPVGWGLKPILVMANGAYDAVAGQDFDAGTLTKDVLSSVLNAYNPVGGTDISSAVVPTVADIPVDIARNESWSGSKIRPDFDKSAPNDIQYFDSLEETAQGRAIIASTKKVHETTGIALSPANINYAVDQIIGGAGRTVKKTFNSILGFFDDKPLPVDEYPFVSRFYREFTDEETGKGSAETEILKTLNSEQSRERFYLRKNAEHTYEELKKLSPEEANAKYEILKETNPPLAKKLKSIAKEEEKGLTYTDRLIQDLGVENGERAKYVYSVLQKMKSDDDKNAYADDMRAKGILSPQVIKQLRALIKGTSETGL